MHLLEDGCHVPLFIFGEMPGYLMQKEKMRTRGPNKVSWSNVREKRRIENDQD